MAANIDAAGVERIPGVTTMPSLHGCFSLGTVLGAGVGLGVTAAHVPVHLYLAGVTALTVAIFLCAIRAIPAAIGRAVTGSRPAVWKDRKLVLIGVVVLAMALAEDAANDWLPLLMVDGHGLDATLSPLVYAGFAAPMTVGGFTASFFLRPFSRIAVIRASTGICSLGLLLVIASDNAFVAGLSVML